ncbi:MAG: anaerobic ribonucleoside-triphosphate reductase [Candidatus Diapherotrites archaeon]
MSEEVKTQNEKINNSDRTKCEVYSRVVGYLRPVDQWNTGKRAEFKDRKTFDKILESEKLSTKC